MPKASPCPDAAAACVAVSAVAVPVRRRGRRGALAAGACVRSLAAACSLLASKQREGAPATTLTSSPSGWLDCRISSSAGRRRPSQRITSKRQHGLRELGRRAEGRDRDHYQRGRHATAGRAGAVPRRRRRAASWRRISFTTTCAQIPGMTPSLAAVLRVVRRRKRRRRRSIKLSACRCSTPNWRMELMQLAGATSSGSSCSSRSTA